ncbi:MAG: DUF2500 domain-containing protein [Oscillospiraceae bacterium]|nr:DUF2500 domain-containing protein [Oscillospiraceae bacterium]
MGDKKRRKRANLVQLLIVLFVDILFVWNGLDLLKSGGTVAAMILFFAAALPTAQVFYNLRKQRVFDRLSLTAPVHTVSAKVNYKTTQAIRIRHYTEPKYIASFELLDKSRKNLPVEVKDLNLLNKGDFGILTYKEQGKFLQFVGFQPQS